MSVKTEHFQRIQSAGEEVANAVSHGVGLLAAITALPILVMAAVNRGDVAGVVAASIFGATMIPVGVGSPYWRCR